MDTSDEGEKAMRAMQIRKLRTVHISSSLYDKIYKTMIVTLVERNDCSPMSVSDDALDVFDGSVMILEAAKTPRLYSCKKRQFG